MQNRTKTYFLSDFHLGASYISDKHGQERRIIRFLDSIKEDAKEIYLLGDILDYWFEYRYVVPRGFVRFFGKIAELTDAGIKVHWFIGNHDIWIFDYLPNELGVDITDGSLIKVIDGKKFYLAHGDGWETTLNHLKCLGLYSETNSARKYTLAYTAGQFLLP